MSRRLGPPVAALLLLLAYPGAAVAVEQSIRLEVDARDMPRKLLHATLTIPCQGGKLVLWYPKWIPGTHAPSGPVQNLGGLRFETADGKVVSWRRDDIETCCIHVEVPANEKKIVARLDYIVNQAAAGSSGYDSLASEALAVINWNTCVLYPGGSDVDKLQVEASLRLPAGWQFAAALKHAKTEGGVIFFHSESLADLIDNPLIAALHVKTFPLRVKNGPPAFLHVASESPGALLLGDNVIKLYSQVVNEAHALFGQAHYPEYHFLLTCSDELGHLGLEHLRCSLNGVRERELIDGTFRRGWVANLLPHEYAHSWCGKFRRPAGMCTSEYHTPEKTDLLWVYEGLTEYLGELLMVRSGLTGEKEYLDYLSWNLGNLMKQEGRKWRSLEDTAIASHQLRLPSSSWNDLRRGQDYYYEGMFLWLEVDLMIRESSAGKHSLDDFCKDFFGKSASKEKVVPYNLADVTASLAKLADHDWTGFLGRRVKAPMEKMPVDFVALCGCKLDYARKPSAYVEFMGGGVGGGGPVSARDSLGAQFAANGKVGNVVPGMPADRAGLITGMQVQAVNGKKFSRYRLFDALLESPQRKQIEFLITDGDHFRTLVVPYQDGPKYLQMVRDAGARKYWFAEILRPLTTP